MFEKREQTEGSLDLMAAELPISSKAITLQDFLGLTGHLPKDTPLFGLIVDDDDVEYARNIVSAAIRIERSKVGPPAMRVELKIESEAY